MTTDVKAAPIPTTDGVSPWLTTLHLATLFHFAVAQPIFDRLNERLSYCRDLNLPSWVVYAFVVLLSVGCPSVVALVVWITRRWSASAAQRLSQICREFSGVSWHFHC